MVTRFLQQLYVKNGAAEISQLQYVMEAGNGLPVELFLTILNRLIEKQYCVVEPIKKLDNTEADIVFVTTEGLERLARSLFQIIRGAMAHGPQYDKIRGDTNIKHILQF